MLVLSHTLQRVPEAHSCYAHRWQCWQGTADTALFLYSRLKHRAVTFSACGFRTIWRKCKVWSLPSGCRALALTITTPFPHLYQTVFWHRKRNRWLRDTKCAFICTLVAQMNFVVNNHTSGLDSPVVILSFFYKESHKSHWKYFSYSFFKWGSRINAITRFFFSLCVNWNLLFFYL